jgi:hypothetical protein
MGIRSFVGAEGPALNLQHQSALEKALSDFNDELSTVSSRQNAAAAFAAFWMFFVDQLSGDYPLIDRLAKFVIRSEVSRLGYQLFEPEILDVKKTGKSFEEWCQEIDENMVSPEDLKPL